MNGLETWLSFILHAGMHLNFRCSPVSVCLGKSLQPAHLSSPLPVSNVLQLTTSRWEFIFGLLAGLLLLVFLKAVNKCVLWIWCHYEYRIAPFTLFLGISVCNDFCNEPYLRPWVLWHVATALLLVWPAQLKEESSVVKGICWEEIHL